MHRACCQNCSKISRKIRSLEAGRTRWRGAPGPHRRCRRRPSGTQPPPSQVVGRTRGRGDAEVENPQPPIAPLLGSSISASPRLRVGFRLSPAPEAGPVLYPFLHLHISPSRNRGGLVRLSRTASRRVASHHMTSHHIASCGPTPLRPPRPDLPHRRIPASCELPSK